MLFKKLAFLLRLVAEIHSLKMESVIPSLTLIDFHSIQRNIVLVCLGTAVSNATKIFIIASKKLFPSAFQMCKFQISSIYLEGTGSGKAVLQSISQ